MGAKPYSDLTSVVSQQIGRSFKLISSNSPCVRGCLRVGSMPYRKLNISPPCGAKPYQEGLIDLFPPLSWRAVSKRILI